MINRLSHYFPPISMNVITIRQRYRRTDRQTDWWTDEIRWLYTALHAV